MLGLISAFRTVFLHGQPFCLTLCSVIIPQPQPATEHLLLQSNNLVSSLPAEVAALHRLVTIRIDDNDMSGQVADDVCEVFNQTLPYFYADCQEIDCPCCIFCCEDETGCSCRYENTDSQYLCY